MVVLPAEVMKQLIVHRVRVGAAAVRFQQHVKPGLLRTEHGYMVESQGESLAVGVMRGGEARW